MALGLGIELGVADESFEKIHFVDVIRAVVVHSVAVGWPMNCMLCFMGTLVLFLLFS